MKVVKRVKCSTTGKFRCESCGTPFDRGDVFYVVEVHGKRERVCSRECGEKLERGVDGEL